MSPLRRRRRNTANNRPRRPNKRYMTTTNLTEGTNNSKQHARKRLHWTGRVQKRAKQGNALISQGSWTGIIPEQKTIPMKKRKKKIWKGIANSRQQTLSGEVTADKKKSRQGYAWKKGGTWPGMQRDYQTNQKRRKKKNTQR